MTSAPIAPGAHIELRDAVWRVQRVDHTSSGTQAWRCIGVSEIVRDQEAVFLEDYEFNVKVLDPKKTALQRDTSQQHRAGLLYIESLLRDVPPPDDALAIGHRAAMDVLDFQLDPAWKALQKPRQRILIADSVGLGKTLEAGILLSELIRRGRARRILVVVTRAMLTQFQKEMWARFSIPLVRLDSVGLQRIRADIPTNHNPFHYFDRTIISIDTLKQKNWFRTHVERARWDVIVIDEAHNVAVRGGSRSDRSFIAGRLARNCDSLILLSATPHDGKAESFASLMNMLDPTAIANPSSYTKEDIRGLYVRRFKHDVKDQLKAHVPERTTKSIRVAATPLEEHAFDLLARLDLAALDAAERGTMLVRTGLEKALFSSPAACLMQLRAPLRRDLLRAQLPPALQAQLNDRETATSDLLARAAALVADPATQTALASLRDLAFALEALTPATFSKYQALLTTLRGIGWKASAAKEDRLVIFTERRETLSFLVDNLVRDLGLKDGQCEVLHGGLSDIEQQRIVEDFGKTSAPVRLLIASDVASEGINLHYLSHRLIHFDVPWSLMIFQQRNGRIDRYGQAHAPEIIYLLTEASHPDIKGDARILELLIKKDDQAQANIGDPSAFLNVFDSAAEELIIAQAMQSKTSADELERTMDKNLLDPFALMFGEGAEPDAAAADSPTSAPTSSPPSLFESDFAFVKAGLARLSETHGVEAKIDDAERLIELHWTPDLERRFGRLPSEVRPDDGWILLTADPARMQRALADARKLDHAWPRHQYLWANNPVVHWLADRMRSEFVRHTAPVLVVPSLGHGAAGPRTTIIVSGLLPNRRGQPLVHRWYAAHFNGLRPGGVEPFETFLATSQLGRQQLPNAKEPIDNDQLLALLAPAVDVVRGRVLEDREAFRQRTRPKIDDELARLDLLRNRQLAFVFESFGERTDASSLSKKGAEELRIERLFADYQQWVKDAMTTADTPFLQVIAILIDASKVAAGPGVKA